jgi:hypothetical protein
MAARLTCATCSFVFQVDSTWPARDAPRAPVHPVRTEWDQVKWRMCTGSGEHGVPRQ